ncbi:unnamed protein product [Caenorhabditis nigoni]
MKTEPPAGFYDYYDVWDVYDQYDQADDDKKVLTINWKFLRIMKIIFYWADRSLIFLAVLTNILQLIVLTRKVMRNNFINVLMFAISLLHYLRYSVNNLKGKMSCLGQKYNTDMYEMYLNAGDGKFLERFHLVETMSHFVYIILYIIINIILAIQLRILRNQRKHVKDDGKTLIVFIFALLFFIHECFYGIVQLMMMFLAPHDVNYAYLVNRVMNLNSLLFIINSIFQSVIPIFLSSQYRKTARRLFWRKKKKSTLLSVSAHRGQEGISQMFSEKF